MSNGRCVKRNLCLWTISIYISCSCIYLTPSQDRIIYVYYIEYSHMYALKTFMFQTIDSRKQICQRSFSRRSVNNKLVFVRIGRQYIEVCVYALLSWV